ncbi:hypothetical protein EYF80_014966 [Liparis tanakae]|uniref:Uncharacterized protein n=1 Tax=Liparis tanakae TaxID=230148 RepID=A0A4Z2IA07_9TELE|nr:hypothetical protein EYF80_014966 [Liparis tanakae]
MTFDSNKCPLPPLYTADTSCTHQDGEEEATCSPGPAPSLVADAASRFLQFGFYSSCLIKAGDSPRHEVSDK